jgi:hypothetical protein
MNSRAKLFSSKSSMMLPSVLSPSLSSQRSRARRWPYAWSGVALRGLRSDHRAGAYRRHLAWRPHLPDSTSRAWSTCIRHPGAWPRPQRSRHAIRLHRGGRWLGQIGRGGAPFQRPGCAGPPPGRPSRGRSRGGVRSARVADADRERAGLGHATTTTGRRTESRYGAKPLQRRPAFAGLLRRKRYAAPAPRPRPGARQTMRRPPSDHSRSRRPHAALRPRGSERPRLGSDPRRREREPRPPQSYPGAAHHRRRLNHRPRRAATRRYGADPQHPRLLVDHGNAAPTIMRTRCR